MSTSTVPSLFRAVMPGEGRSRFAAVPLKNGDVLQVKPTKATYDSVEAWERSVRESLGEGVSVNFKTEMRAKNAAVSDVNRLRSFVRKCGLKSTNRVVNICLDMIRRLEASDNTGSRATLTSLKNKQLNDPVSFYSLNRAPLAWKDGETMRPIGFVNIRGPSAHWAIVNDKGVIGQTLAELGIPADAELFIPTRTKVVQTTYTSCKPFAPTTA